MKKIFAIVVAILLCISLFPMLTGANIAKANGGPFFSIERDKSAKRNGSVSLLISVSDNPGFVTAPLEVGYDTDVLTLTSVDSLVSEMPISQYAPSSTPGVQRILLVNSQLIDWVGNGQVARLNFDVKDDASEGESRIDLSFPAGLPANSVPEYLESAGTSWGSVVIEGEDEPSDPRTLIEFIKPAPINNLMHGTLKTRDGLGLSQHGTVMAVIEDSNGQRTQESVAVTWDVANCPYVVNASSSQSFIVYGDATLPSNVRNPNNRRPEIDVSVNGPGVGQYTLIRVIQPNPITGLPNGTPKTDTGLRLPEAVRMETTGGNVWTTVDWNMSESSYAPASKNEQTFIVDGMAHLPEGVNNFNNISKAVKVSVTVNGVDNPPPPGPGNNDTYNTYFIGNPYTQDSTGSGSSSGYGRVPQTGIADHTALIPAIAVSLMITIILVVYIVRSKSLNSDSGKE